jgi:hypothetical protein
MTDYIPDESKKQPLFEIFRAAVWAPLVGEAELKDALEAGKKAGVTEQDLGILEADAKTVKAYFGEAAISRDLVNAMKAGDQFTSGMGNAFGWGGGPTFKKAGYY